MSLVSCFPATMWRSRPKGFASRQHATAAQTELAKAKYHPWVGGSNRFATLFIYLSSVEDGGGTVFPHAAFDGRPPRPEEYVNMSACSNRGLLVSPVKGKAVLFYNQNLDGHKDSASEHGGCPVVQVSE